MGSSGREYVPSSRKARDAAGGAQQSPQREPRAVRVGFAQCEREKDGDREEAGDCRRGRGTPPRVTHSQQAGAPQAKAEKPRVSNKWDTHTLVVLSFGVDSFVRSAAAV